MLDELNKIRNSDFARGTTKPTAWTWHGDDKDIQWELAPPSGNGNLAGVHIHARRSAATDRSATTCHNAATGFWAQSFRPKKDQHYRIEAVVSCDCKTDPKNSGGGLVLRLQPFDADGKACSPVSTSPLLSACERTIRAYYKTPPNTRRVELRVGLIHAEGFAAIHDVRVVPVLELDAKSHPWAIPAPPFAIPAPLGVKNVCVVTDQPGRPLVEMLRASLGKDAVRTCSARGFRSAVREADAVILPDARPPASCRSMDALAALAKNRIVVVSLPAMEAISGEQLVTRMVRQIDDPLNARVRYADFVTSGFALYDIVPFAGRSDHSTAMFQRQFRVNSVFRKFCQEHNLEVLLESETDSDATSQKPIALFRRTSGGAVVVMDVEPAEAVTSTLNEPVVAAQLILASLGASETTLGQYSAVARDADEFHSHVRDIVNRFPELSFSGGAAPLEPESPYIITVGEDLDIVGLPLVPRPTILIRTCLRGDDIIGAYGVMLWLKQLLRKAPYDSPYAKTLASAFRIAWMPLSTPIATWGGWRNDDDVRMFPMEIEFDRGSIAAVIDVTTARCESVNILTPRRDAFQKALSDTIPTMLTQIVAGSHIRHAGSATDHPSSDWRTDNFGIEVTTDKTAFREQIHESAAAAGADMVRVEVPGSHSASFASSVWQTEWIAHTIEQIAGMLLGALIVNRSDKPLTVRCPKRIKNQLATAVMRKIGQPDQDLPRPKIAGNRLTIPPAHAIIAVSSE